MIEYEKFNVISELTNFQLLTFTFNLINGFIRQYNIQS